MGHRANYAMREAGQLSVYYSHWGARTIPADVFWGPAPAESVIRGATPNAEWVDSVFAEGGIALDKDSRRAMFFGDGELLGSEEIDELFGRLIGHVWSASGWELAIGANQGDLVEFCGLRRSLVELPETVPSPFSLSRLGENYAQGFVCGLVGHRTQSGFTDRVLDFALSGILLNGPACLPHVARLPTLDDLRADTVRRLAPKSAWQRAKERLRPRGAPDRPPPRPYNENITNFALVDETARTLSLSEAYDDGCASWLPSAWPGWHVTQLDGGLAGYYRETNRPVPADLVPPPPDPPPAQLTPAEALAEIERYLFGADETKQRLHRMTTDFVRESDPATVYAPGFTTPVPSLALFAAERRAIWAAARDSVLNT